MALSTLVAVAWSPMSAYNIGINLFLPHGVITAYISGHPGKVSITSVAGRLQSVSLTLTVCIMHAFISSVFFSIYLVRLDFQNSS